MRYFTLGILAHVDAGKTSLSESLLFESGMIGKTGRVDHKDAFLDTHALEKERGITIFSKQAVIDLGDMRITLLDTPGHVDFSSETERTMQVLDAAILVVSASDGVQSHTRTIWSLLRKYDIPVFVFFNKMDIAKAEKKELLSEISGEFEGSFIDLTGELKDPAKQEELALCDEGLLERFLENGEGPGKKEISDLIRKRKLFPCYFGSALKEEGIRDFLFAVRDYSWEYEGADGASARVFKISYDDRDQRLAFLKITGGCFHIKDRIGDEKIEDIRLYSGRDYESLKEAGKGMVVAFTGVSSLNIGDEINGSNRGFVPVLEPVLTYRVLSLNNTDPILLISRLKKLEEEDPSLKVVWEEEKREILVRLMGQIQIEIIKKLMKERFNEDIDFVQGSIIYKESIEGRVEGVGHFEPLRHYAEVHLILEGAKAGSGIIIENRTPPDTLSTNWQNLILTHLKERIFKGALIGAPITDIRIILASGKAHLKHTEGGDFRQAVYRAVRNGLMKAQKVLLEPWYNFRLFVPESCIGRAMTDLDRMGAVFELKGNGGGRLTLTEGRIAASQCINYADEVRKYTRGEGRLELAFRGYERCHDSEKVVEASGYDPERDTFNSGDSVFCAHGAGFVVPWYEVEKYMHLPSVLKEETGEEVILLKRKSSGISALSIDEIDAIIERTYYSNRRAGKKENRTAKKMQYTSHLEDKADGSYEKREAFPDKYEKRAGKKQEKPQYILIDGYNVIFAWEELKSLAKLNVDAARDKLLDIACNYRGLDGREMIVVFDAYRVQGHAVEFSDFHNIHVVYTREAQTADSYIEHFAHENATKYDVTVVTSDMTEQVIVLGAGCRVVSSADFRDIVIRTAQNAAEEYIPENKIKINSLSEKFADKKLDLPPE